jgi:two-component system cell cycle sensor histidine kinase PleC
VSGRGAGLGLAIVRGLADLHGGGLTLARRPAGGTRACVHLPAARLLDALQPAGAPDAAAVPLLRAAAE